jgi:leader peptidase (prepilin peptidase) / N-methyltransferase
MSVLGAAALCATVAGAGGLLVPRIIGAVPEPDPIDAPVTELSETVLTSVESSSSVEVPDRVVAAVGAEVLSDHDMAAEPVPEVAVPTPESEPKVLYAELARRPGLGWRSALAAAASGAVLGAILGWSWALLVLVPLVPVMVALSVIDWNTRLLPTWLIKPTYFLTIALVLVAGLASWDFSAVLRSGLGWLAMGAFYFVLWFLHPRGLGYGDVRLSGILGLAAGFVGWAELVAGAWCGFVLGGVLGGLLALLRIVDRKGVPFGPFMVVGVLLGLLLGPAFVAARG